jgi:hypothetical protein
MADNNKKLANLKVKSIHEFKKFLFYFCFLFAFLSAFIVYRRIVLQQYGISYTHYGFALIEALLLAKIIMLGEMFRLDKHFPNTPLIVPVFYNTLLFSLFIAIFVILEHFFVGLLSGHKISMVYHEFVDKRLYEILSNIFIMLLVLIPFFSILEIRRLIGEAKLFNLFFRRRNKKWLKKRK